MRKTILESSSSVQIHGEQRVNRNGLFMELSDQEHDDVVDNDRRKRAGVSALTGQDSRSHAAMLS